MGIFDKSNFEVTTENGLSVFAYKDKDVYTKNSPVPQKVLKEVAKYNETYANEAAELAISIAKDHMKKNSNVEKTIVEVPYSPSARGNIITTIDRSKEVRLPNTGEVEQRSAIKVIVKDPAVKISKSKIREASKELTSVLVK